MKFDDFLDLYILGSIFAIGFVVGLLAPATARLLRSRAQEQKKGG